MNAPAPDERSAVSSRVWPSLAATAAALAYFLWAGTSYDPRLVAIWTTTPHGWFVPAPGLFHLALAACLLFGALCSLAVRSRQSISAGQRAPAAMTVVLISLILAGYWVVFATWKPLLLSPESLRAHGASVPAAWRAAACVADIITAALLAAVAWARRSPGGILPVALFALHPLILREAANGDWMNCLVPLVVFLAAISPRLKPRIRELLICAGAATGVFWCTYVAFGQARPFDGIAALWIHGAGVEGSAQLALLAVLELALQALICALAIAARWDLAKAWGHMLVAWALLAPAVFPQDVVLIVALLPLAWTRAGSVLSFTALIPYAAFVVLSSGGNWQLPPWLIYLTLAPVGVVEVEELVMEALAFRRARNSLIPSYSSVTSH